MPTHLYVCFYQTYPTDFGWVSLIFARLFLSITVNPSNPERGAHEALFYYNTYPRFTI